MDYKKTSTPTRQTIIDNSSITNMMLAYSLLKAISECQYFLFINTNNSVELSSKDEVDEVDVDSPWLFFELNAASLLSNKRVSIKDSRSTDLPVEIKKMQTIHNINDLLDTLRHN